MAFCPNCGSPVEAGAKFCTNCGATIQSGAQNNQYQQNNGQYNYQQNQQYNQYQQYNYQQNQQYQQQYRQYNGPVKPVSFGQRNIAMAIILSIVTCGIYAIIWMINLVDQLNEAADNPDGTPGGTVFLLSIVTCGIYQYYWLYKSGELINTAKGRRGLPVDSNAGIIYLVLAIFGLSIVSYALLQTELNKVAEFHGAPKA